MRDAGRLERRPHRRGRDLGLGAEGVQQSAGVPRVGRLGIRDQAAAGARQAHHPGVAPVLLHHLRDREVPVPLPTRDERGQPRGRAVQPGGRRRPVLRRPVRGHRAPGRRAGEGQGVRRHGPRLVRGDPQRLGEVRRGIRPLLRRGGDGPLQHGLLRPRQHLHVDPRQGREQGEPGGRERGGHDGLGHRLDEVLHEPLRLAGGEAVMAVPPEQAGQLLQGGVLGGHDAGRRALGLLIAGRRREQVTVQLGALLRQAPHATDRLRQPVLQQGGRGEPRGRPAQPEGGRVDLPRGSGRLFGGVLVPPGHDAHLLGLRVDRARSAVRAEGHRSRASTPPAGHAATASERRTASAVSSAARCRASAFRRASSASRSAVARRASHSPASRSSSAARAAARRTASP